MDLPDRPGSRPYVVPYARLFEQLQQNGENASSLSMTIGQFQACIRLILRGVEVDEEWYQRHYPDVKEAITAGVFRSAKHHFVESGYFEGRRPAPVVVDEEWYGRAYADVGEGIEFGEIQSCQDHFERYGEKEGRFPTQD